MKTGARLTLEIAKILLFKNTFSTCRVHFMNSNSFSERFSNLEQVRFQIEDRYLSTRIDCPDLTGCVRLPDFLRNFRLFYTAEKFRSCQMSRNFLVQIAEKLL